MGEILPHFCLESSVQVFDDACFDGFVFIEAELNFQVGESSLKGCIQNLFTLARL